MKANNMEDSKLRELIQETIRQMLFIADLLGKSNWEIEDNILVADTIREIERIFEEALEERK